MTVITRFAPSPTGLLHIGSARTALFNYLFAKHHQGKFLLRIEDTDQIRSTSEAVDAIFSGLTWLGLNWDDHNQVIFQSKRHDLYQEAALTLLATGQAYYCFTSQEEIIKQRDEAIANKQHFIFNSPWRDADPINYPTDIKPVIRLKAPRQGSTIIHDTLQGDVVIKNDHLDDMVLLRGDGTATYMLAVVVDDHDMRVTNIIRGDDHLTNAARQILLYQAFGWSVPIMTHIPLIHGTDGAKLSKRHGALGVQEYQKMGYLPEALCNYLLRLGWGHKDEEIISRQQAIEWFDLEGLSKAPARLDFAKIDNLNAHYLRQMDDAELVEILANNSENNQENINKHRETLIKAMASLKVRCKNLRELEELSKIYWDDYINYSAEAEEVIKNCDIKLITQIISELANLQNFDQDAIQIQFKEIASSHNIKLGELMKPVRALITGVNASPSLFEIMAIIGKEDTLKRLQRFKIFCSTFP